MLSFRTPVGVSPPFTPAPCQSFTLLQIAARVDERLPALLIQPTHQIACGVVIVTQEQNGIKPKARSNIARLALPWRVTSA